MGTLALVVCSQGKNPHDKKWVLVDHFSDDREVAVLEASFRAGECDPLESIRELRARQAQEDDEFGDYVEELLCKPCVRPEVQEHGLQWLKSKIKIEQFQAKEREASVLIADYAFRVFETDPQRNDFILAGPVAQVRIRVWVLHETKELDRPQVA